MSEVYAFACSACWRDRQEHVTVETVEVDHVEVSSGEAVRAWEHRCPKCAAVCGVSIDYGTLDLGSVRDSQVRRPPDGTFELFP